MADEKKENEASKKLGKKQPAPGKKDTSRIELSEAEASDADMNSPGGEPLSVRQVVNAPDDSAAEKKSHTSRIDLDQAEALSDDDVTEAAKNTTVRVDLTGAMARMKEIEQRKAAAEAAAQDESTEDERDTTARISLEGVEHVESSDAISPEPPRTVRLKRPSSAPRTVVMKKPASSEADAASTPRTVVMKKPASPEAEDEPVSDKGTTSRIHIPEEAITEAPQASRKTIRIKRSGAPSGGGAGAKTLTIARPSKATGPTLSAQADAVRETLEAEDSDEPGALFGVLTIAAALVLCVLVYVLVAQTVAPDLPFPGRIL